jgi:phosphatidylglycerol lysyltransferase
MQSSARLASPAESVPAPSPCPRPAVDAGEAPSTARANRSLRTWLLPVVSVALFAAALWVMHAEVARLHLQDVLRETGRVHASAVFAALVLTATSYWLLGLYDVLGLRYIRRRIPYARAAFVSFIAFAFGHNLSLAALTGSAVRYRLYASMGLSAADVALLSAFVSFTTCAGLAILGGTALLLKPDVSASILHIAPALAQVLGGAVLAAVLAYIVWGLFPRAVLSIRGWSIAPPNRRLMWRQLSLAVIELTMSAAVLWSLLPTDANVGLPTFIGVYALAVIAGVVSNVPGGLGVFEAVIMIGLPQARPEALLASLVVYRLIYYLVPLLVATVLFAGKELNAQRSRIALIGNASGRYIAPLVPQVAGVLTFIAGAALLLSGFAPALDARLGALRSVLPLSLLELSHLTGSIVGLALLILSRSLMERVAAARHIAVWLLVVGIGAALLRGPDLEAAAMLAAILFLLHMGRSAFYRPASILDERFTPAWIASIAVVLTATLCIGFFAQRHVEYANVLWWTFAVDGDAPRTLRAALVIVLLAAAYVTSNLLRPARPLRARPSYDDIALAKTILRFEDDTLGQVALSGDKRLLFASSGDAFLMYQVIGRSWIALGDPVGRTDPGEELVWRFRELSDHHGGRAAFYQVSAERLSVYIDLGLVPLKLGEEARVAVDDFRLESSAMAALRQAHRRGSREGLTFEVAPAGAALQYFDDLANISNAWLGTKKTAEKHFSVGAFSADYLVNFPIVLIRRAGSLVAFANLWTSATHEEISVDLMRFAPRAPNGTMDYLFVELLLWARAHGYRWLNLGMAPLSGLGARRLAPRWHQVGGFVFRHGEHFYNFQGLRRYKAKFGPVWTPRYLLAPGGMALPRILADTSLLISGGLRGLLTK